MHPRVVDVLDVCGMSVVVGMAAAALTGMIPYDP